MIKESVRQVLRENEIGYYFKDIDNDFDGDIEKQKNYSWDLYNDKNTCWEDFVDDEDNIYTIKRTCDGDYSGDMDYLYQNKYKSNKLGCMRDNGYGAKTAMGILSYIDGKSRHYPPLYDYPTFDYTKGDADVDDKRKSNRIKKQWVSQEKRKTNNAFKSADMRPLHRKGSLNRAFDD